MPPGRQSAGRRILGPHKRSADYVTSLDAFVLVLCFGSLEEAAASDKHEVSKRELGQLSTTIGRFIGNASMVSVLFAATRHAALAEADRQPTGDQPRRHEQSFVVLNKRSSCCHRGDRGIRPERFGARVAAGYNKLRSPRVWCSWRTSYRFCNDHCYTSGCPTSTTTPRRSPNG